MLVALLTATAVLAVVGLGSWLFLSGRLGFGPLSAKDEAAVAVISGAIDGPRWADDNIVACAADALLHHTRSKKLAEHGTLRESGDGWVYTEHWEAADASAFGRGLLTCSDDWESLVADEWRLEDSGCLGGIGLETMGRYFGGDLLAAADDEESAEEARADAVETLDHCYVREPERPKAKAQPGYRSVKFDIDAPKVDNAFTTTRARHQGRFESLRGNSYTVSTEEGGRRVCVIMRTTAEYGWGTTSKARKRVCGRAEPPKLWWEPAKRCNELAPAGYACFDLHYEGLKSSQKITVDYTHNGGDCISLTSGCTSTITTEDNGRGAIINYGFPVGYNGHFVAKVGDLEAVLPVPVERGSGREDVA